MCSSTTPSIRPATTPAVDRRHVSCARLARSHWRSHPAFPDPANLADFGSAVSPKELQSEDAFTRKGDIVHWNDRDAGDKIEGDFAGLKDLHQGAGRISRLHAVEALRSLAEAYEYWIAYADLDG